jgi:hypothetical protein
MNSNASHCQGPHGLDYCGYNHTFLDLCRVLLSLERAMRIANIVQQMSCATRGTSGPVTVFVKILNDIL